MHREVLAEGRAWIEFPVVVIRDDSEVFATYLAAGTRFHFPPGSWPNRSGLHPWQRDGRTCWQGHGVVMLRRAELWHSVWVFWSGEARAFAGWYVNFEEPFRRMPNGYDTRDLELDIWIPRGGSWGWKDQEAFDRGVESGWFTPYHARAVRAEAARVASALDGGRFWWSADWASWTPNPSWARPERSAE
jgi:hypothetical protein